MRTKKGKEKEVKNVIEELNNLAKPSNEDWTARQQLNEDTWEVYDMERIVGENKLFWMTPEEREELVKKFSGLPKLVLKKMVENTGKYQHSIGYNIFQHATGSVLGIFPFTGIAYSNSGNRIIDKLQKIIEHSLNIPELKEVLAEYEDERQKKLLMIRDYVAAEQEKDAKIVDLEKQLRKAKNEIAELKSRLETQIEESELQAQIQILPKSPQ